MSNTSPETTPYVPTDDDIRLAWVTHPENHETGPEAVAPFHRWLAAHDAEIRILEREHPGDCTNCGHLSDCSLHNGPALPVKSCNCRRSSPFGDFFGDVMGQVDGLVESARALARKPLPTVMTDYTRPTLGTPAKAADLIESEMRDGFLHEGVLAPDSPIAEALRVLIAEARRSQ